MVCDDTDGNISLCIFSILCISKTANVITQCLECIHIKDRIYILYNRCQTFQSHSGINIFLLQFGIMSMSVIIKLCKYVVPDFHITVAFTTYRTIRAAASVFFPSVIIDLGTRTAWAGTMLPEIVCFSKTENTLCRDPHFLIPDFECLFIFFVYGRIQSVWIQTYYLCQKFPGPFDCFILKVISKREVSKHLKECTMTCCLSYILDISCTDTFLTGCHSASRRDLLSCEVRL